MNDYERGLRDGVKSVAAMLRRAADRVGATERRTFTSESGKVHDAVARVADIPFSTRLNEVADILDEVAKDVSELSKESAKI